MMIAKSITVVSGLCVLFLCACPVVAEETQNPHDLANQCLSQPCETLECRIACEADYNLCHMLPYIPELNGATPWNLSGQEISEVYLEQMGAVENLLKDKCLDCHQGHYETGLNHPVDVDYPNEGTGNNGYINDPSVDFLICDEEGGCIIGCTSCHMLHPLESEGQDVTSLLRLKNERSMLCTSCHEL